MAKINIKNTTRNQLITFLKDNSLTFQTEKTGILNRFVTEKIVISCNNESTKRQLEDILIGYGTQAYHDTTFRVNLVTKNIFNYSCNSYESIIADSTELELPNFYIENLNQQNENHRELKSLNPDIITKQYLMNIKERQQTLNIRTSEQLKRFQNILFGNNFSTVRSNVNLDEFPYYNKINILSDNDENTISSLSKKLKFQEELAGGILSQQNSVGVDLTVNGDDTTVAVKDILEVLETNPLTLEASDKIILGDPKQNDSYMTKSFNRFLLRSALQTNIAGDMLSFEQMYQNVEAKKEILLYRIDKFVDDSEVPLQTFWYHGDSEGITCYDYQIVRNKSYRYKIFGYCLIYGAQTTLSYRLDGDVFTITMQYEPSYKYAAIPFDEKVLKVMPKIPLPPYVAFYNENNEENKIKIYLSLKNGARKDRFVALTQEDSAIFNNIEAVGGLYDFDYEIQDGKFEVYRLSTKPKSIQDFDNAKIIEARNSISTTDIIFRENIMPNKKYYFMFRSINFIGIPSNPSPVYEVELIKMASTSKIAVSVISLEEEKHYHDKTFKNLIQIKPAFQQEVFDDQREDVQALPTFKKKINDLTLGTATDKVWGKKFKIRVKSKDTGKIIDLNVKFNLIKDNTE